MDELGFNKIAAAVLATGLGFMFIKEISHSALHVTAPETPAYFVGTIGGDATEAAAPVDLPFPQPDWIAAMDSEKGAKVFKKCTSCHNAENGGANSTGPNLWNVVGAPAGTHAGFNYSGVMADSGLVWDYETLDGYLERPGRYLSGTAMNFIGLKKPADRAAVIEYLRLQADNPLEQPEPALVETAEVLETAEDIAADTQEVLEGAADTAQDVVEGTVEEIVDDAETTLQDIVETVEDTVEDIKEDVTPPEEQE